VASFLLLPVYVRYLSPADYGAIALLLTVEVVAKILFRWGVDASFMRLYFDCPDTRARQQLASTIFVFLFLFDGLLLLGALAASPALAAHLFDNPGYSLPLRLVLVHTFIGAFFFLPFHVLRIENRPMPFVALTFMRSASTLVLRLVLVVFVRLGVVGIVLADLISTATFALVLAPRFAALLRPTFSMQLLREALRFGLPRLPHGIAHQVVAAADRYLLSLSATLSEIGLYSVGASFGLALKLFLSAFEQAWAPFYFAAMKQPDAPRLFSVITTYAVAVLVLLVAGISAIADDLVSLMTRPAFYGAARVIPWIAVGVSLQGIYLLTSIGLNITKRTTYYPITTAIAAATSVAANLLLIPRFGAMGAAGANVIAYAVLAATAGYLSQRFYPIAYEWRRVAHVVVAGAALYAVATLLPHGMPAAVGVLARGAVVAGGLPVLLYVTRFFHARELARVAAVARFMRHRIGSPTLGAAEMAGEIVGSTLQEAEAPQVPSKDRATT
jgi:O-antigen/teichoic acid export membrane protein